MQPGPALCPDNSPLRPYFRTLRDRLRLVDPPTLGQDLAHLAERGYRPDVVEAYDLFPHTSRLETVVRLRVV